ncbi:MAG: type II toxin-antitoxin system RelE/ParE family toxin [Chitinophagaceae bacterium]
MSDNFKKEFKRLLKKYPSLKKEGEALTSELKNNPQIGTKLGNNCYKIRLSIASKGRGKSGGARIITYVKIEKHTVFILSIYDKAERDSISDTEIKNLLKSL